MEGPSSKGEEPSKKAPATTTSSSGRRGKEVSVNAVNQAHPTPQQYSVNLTAAPTAAPAYFPPPPQHQPQSIYYSAPPVPPPMTSQLFVHHYTLTPTPSPQPRPPVSRAPPPAQQSPASQGPQILPITPGPNFDPTTQDQSKHYEYHQGAPRHTLDNCWRLRDEIQRRIDNNRFTFNAIRPPNVQANPLPDHRPSSGSSINMISICTLGEDTNAQGNPLPFVIDYTPQEPTVGFAGDMASPAPFVVDIPAREPYLDNKVPWTYKGGIGSIERQFSVMGVTSLGRVYENSVIVDKGKALAAEVGAVPERTPFPSKRVTEEEAEAFMKIMKASEYKVVEQMAKSLAHISLLALLLSSEPHREALLRINVDLNRVRPSKTAVRAFDGSRREKLITVKGEEDYAIYKETAVPYISVGDDENLQFHSFETISVIRDYGEIGLSRADRMIWKALLRHNYILGTGLGARGQGINRPIEVKEYKHRRGLGFCPSCHEIIEARWGNHLHRLVTHYGRLNRGMQFFQFLRLHSNPNLRHVDSNPLEECFGEPEPIYFGEGLDEDNQIGTGLDPTQRARMIDFLTRYQEVFAWSHADMPGFLEVCNYSEWVANIVLIEKKDGRVRVCVDYRDLNKASPKGNFPLPHIDVLVDNTARHAQFSFMDGFSGYNQIRMAEEDKIKTTFTTMWGTFCYRVMPFGLKNAEATYQRAMVTLFHDMMHKEVERLRQYMLYHTIPLKYLLDSPSSMRNIAKWHCKLTEYDIEYVSRTSVKGQAIADHLAEFPIKDNTPINPDFPDERILQVEGEEEKPGWKMYFDGAINSARSGIGTVLISPDGRYYPVAAKIDFPCTNNVAEYEACIIGLQAAIDFKLVPYHEYLERLTENFEDISFTYTPRLKNQFADALATLASMVSITRENLIEPLEIEIAKGLAHCNGIEASEAKPWYEDIRNFLRTGQYPPFTDHRDRKTLRRLAMHYFLSGEILYHRSFDSTLLRCIDEHESRRLMEEMHGGSCGPHMNGLMLAKKIMRLGYY
ncbi:hypothetical protein CRG98_012627 [Punica granatum]|uniref:G-patch domain-containing protein n=1 Tax=Punica granatum TaxID=22663 RepID=A0A2I0KEM2_PUNGR|nr:hypothetical protein CRG98_012627 [Punica granatum]